MGLCISHQNITEKTKIINKKIQEEKRKKNKEIKLLLLGGSESGKSTVLKQLRILNQKDFLPQEREQYRIIIFSNIIQTVSILLEYLEIFEIRNLDNAVIKILKYYDKNYGLESDEPFPIEYGNAIKKLLENADIKTFLSKYDDNQLDDSSRYFLENIDRLFSVNYKPNNQDILRCRVRTTGISQTVFIMDQLNYRVIDVGGQRNERKKWIHCFDNITAVIFLAAISGYDQTEWEDEKTNQMYESLLLFDSICNNKWFLNTSIILFLNKIDIFARKIKYSPVSRYFPDFTGNTQSLSETSLYFKNRFESLNRNSNKFIYTHFTFATDTKTMRNIMQSVNDIILVINLRNATVL